MSRPLHGMLICAYNDMRDSYVTHRLIEEARRSDVMLSVVGVADTCLAHDGVLHNNAAMIQASEFALLRYKEGHVKDYLAGLCERSYNGLVGFNRFVDKYEQLKMLKGTPLVYPDYLLASSETSFDLIVAHVGLPFVIKGLRSSMGREVFLVSNERDFHTVVQRFGTGRELLYETYIASSHGRDMRVFVVRGDAICAMQRTSSGGMQANFAVGAKVTPIQVTDEMRHYARYIYELTKLDYFGLDLLYGSSGAVFCEINVMPGFEGMERATGINVASVIINMIRSDFL